MLQRLLLAALTFSLIIACKDSTSPEERALPCDKSGSAAVVNATDGFAFSPQTVTVTVGESVCWQNIGTQAHTVTDNATNGNRFGAELPADQSFIHAFGFGGNFEYRCRKHANMTATVVVRCKPGDFIC